MRKKLIFLLLFTPFFLLAQTDSLNMRLLGMWVLQDTSNHNHISCFAVSGDYLFIFTEAAPRHDTVHVVNVENPSSPYIVSEIGDLGGSMTIYGDFLYIGWDYLGIIDVSIPESPEVMYRGDIIEGSSRMYMYPYENDGRIYLAVTCFVEIDGERKPGIRIVDVTDPSSPELLDWYYVPEEITDWYYVVHHNLASISVVYPHLFAFETIEYVDTSFYWGGYEDGYVQVKMFDLRDLSAPPVVWRSERMGLDWATGIVWGGAGASSSSVIVSFEPRDENIVDIMFYEDPVFTDLCEVREYIYPMYVVNDTYYVTGGAGARAIAIKVLRSCEIETLGYYNFGGWLGEHMGIKAFGDKVYVLGRNRIYILGWIDERIVETEGKVSKRYAIYPTPVVYGMNAQLNEELDRRAGIYDISGKLRSILEPGVREIDTRGLSPGVYFLISDDKKIRLKFVVI